MPIEFEPLPRVFGHDVDLQRLLVVVHAQRLVVGLGELAASGLQLHGDRRPEHGQALAEGQDLLLVQPEQGPVEQPRDVFDMRRDLEIAGERRGQGAQRRLDLDVVPARRVARASREELEQTGRPGAPDLGGAGQGVPRTLQHDREMLAVGLADREAAEALAVVAAVAREAPDQALDDVGPDGGVPGVAQLLRGELEIEERALPRLEVGRELAQPADQLPFQIAGGGEPLPRAVRHAQMQEHGDGGVVRGDAQSLEIRHRLAQPPAGQPAGPAQIVRADPLVGIRLDQAPDEVEQLLAVGSGDRGFAQPFPRGLEVRHLQRGGIDLHPVLLAQKQRRLLEPGDGGLHAGVVGRGVPDEVAVELLLDDLAGRGDDLAVAFRSLLQPPQGPQDGRDLPLLQPASARSA